MSSFGGDAVWSPEAPDVIVRSARLASGTFEPSCVSTPSTITTNATHQGLDDVIPMARGQPGEGGVRRYE